MPLLQYKTSMLVEIEGVPLHLAHPDELNITWVGQEEVMRQLLAAWLVISPQDLPMNPRLLGKPGVGKTTLAYAAGKRLGREIYILQATVDTRPEDLIVTPVIEGERKLRYVASPLVTAMLRGGIVILDEGNRMSEKSWASWRRSWTIAVMSNRSSPGSRSKRIRCSVSWPP